jgi:hypothetical protein
LRGFEKEVLKRILRFNIGEVTRRREICLNEVLHNFFSARHRLRVIKSKSIT